MIEIKKITKIYKSKKKNNHKALDNVNLILPNNGLVFVIGKSGSGKSTLLNLLGGLDNTTSGSIIVDGNDITNYKEKDLANYRNNHIGFIFQDYHLLDELTVYENIVLSLNLNKLEDSGLVLEALDKVGLSGYQNRYPQELSGGERQRVAIARAIVKKPYIILADEPTGNLDNETGTQIVSLLKELSKECLILIVSHNTIDTYKYADRIIKLSNGNIISDETRNPKYLDNVTYQEGVMYYPMDKTLTNEDIHLLNDKLDNKNLKKVVGVSDKYITSTTNKEERNIKIDKKNLSIKNMFKLCLTFLKSKVFRITASSFMIAVIMVILALSQTIITFDSGKIIKDEMDKANQNSMLIKLPNLETNPVVENEYFYEVLDDELINEFKLNNENENVYELINYSVPVCYNDGSSQMYRSYFHKNALYYTHGTLIVNEQFFVDKIGKCEYVEVLDNPDKRGVYITDYIADLIFELSPCYKNKEYKDILGLYSYPYSYAKVSYINGIIKTDYKTKYAELLNRLKNVEDANELANDKEYQRFVSEIYDYLGYSYSFNPDFVEDSINDPLIGYANAWWLTINNELVTNFNSGRYVYRAKYMNLNFKENEVSMSYQKYNELFNTNYDSSSLDTFVPHEIKITQHRYYDYSRKDRLNEFTITVKQLHDDVKYCKSMFICDEESFKQFVKSDVFTAGIYINEPQDMTKIMEFYEKYEFEFQTMVVQGIHTMTKAVDVFIPIFELVAIVLCAGIVFILISFSTKMIKDKIHDIGILKALGCKNNTIGIVFGLQLLLIALCTIILSTIGYFFFIDLSNDVLIESLKVLAPSHIVLDLDFLTFKMNIVYINSLLVLILSLISFVIPMLKIYNIKPVQIIKTKE